MTHTHRTTTRARAERAIAPTQPKLGQGVRFGLTDEWRHELNAAEKRARDVAGIQAKLDQVRGRLLEFGGIVKDIDASAAVMPCPTCASHLDSDARARLRVVLMDHIGAAVVDRTYFEQRLTQLGVAIPEDESSTDPGDELFTDIDDDDELPF